MKYLKAKEAFELQLQTLKMKKEKAETAALRNSLEQTLMAVSAAVQKGDNNNNSSGVGEGGDSKGKEKEKEKEKK